ncbi:MAG: adenine deaminase [Oligoflexia bacterium]|nr:adenine deaminase [Oligoflexia bacterium]
MGRRACDLVIRNVRYLDVFSCAWRRGNLAISDGMIVGLEPGLKAHREIDAKGAAVVPGFIDAHVHIESSLLTPDHFEAAVLPKGTTTAVCDPHELANVLGVDGLRYFLQASEELSLDLRVMLSSCVPATHFETNGGGTIEAEQLLPLAAHANALGLAEMMNVPGVLNADPQILAKIEGFAELGKPIDGHCPLVRGQALSAYAAAGITSCHESSEFEEAAEKLTKGIAVWIREGSVAKDLHALVPLLTMATSTSIGFCTDDRNPLDIASQGHIDYLVREAIRLGVAPEIAYRSASWSVARHYGLKRKGAIAPGYEADLILLGDEKSCAIQNVLRRGVPVGELPAAKISAAQIRNTIRAKAPEASDLTGPSGRVHVIGVRAGRILTDRHVMNHDAKGVARLSVMERYGHGSKPANGYVTGFGAHFDGAIASSVGHDSHNLIVAGKNEADMKIALAALIESGGGFCVARQGAVQALLPLPFGGLMSERPAEELTRELKKMHEASRATGCELPEPFLQLAFLSLPVIPSLKLTDKGLVDVEKFQMIDVRAS